MRRAHHSNIDAQDFNWQVIKKLLPFLLEYKRRVFFALACLILTKVASVYLPFILKDLVDTLDNKQTSEPISMFILPLGLVLAYGLVRFTIVIFAEIRDTLFARVTERAIRRIGLQVFRHLHQLDLDFHLNRQTGGLSRDIDRGTSGISFLMRFMVFNIIPTLFEIMMVISILLINYGFWFAFITFSAIVFYVLYSVKATEWRTRFVREANKADSSSNTRAIDSLINYETVKYFTNEDFEAKAYDQQLAKWEQAKLQNRLSLFALNGGQALIVALSMTAMLALAAHNVLIGEMTIGDFVLINAFMMQLFIPLNFLGFVYREMKGSLANIENFFGLLDKKSNITDIKNAKALQVQQGSIIFENVSFHYQAARPIINNVSFTINAGEKLAIVGESGSGKSTLVKLLFRFYDTTSGKIIIDGQDISLVAQQSLRQQIAIVPQDTVLFNESLFDNIHYGKPTASKAEVFQAIKMAHLENFVQSLPQGVDTLVGERGLKLSGGEKQRVAIARAILKNPPIMVFDEATSSLDSHAEQAILTAIKEVSKNHTSLVIAHRLSTITDADNIVVLVQGQIVEQGTHQQLLSLKGHYYQMWQLQQHAKND